MNALPLPTRRAPAPRAVAALAGLLLTLVAALGTASPAEAAPRASGPAAGPQSLSCVLFAVCPLEAPTGYRTLEKFP